MLHSMCDDVHRKLSLPAKGKSLFFLTFTFALVLNFAADAELVPFLDDCGELVLEALSRREDRRHASLDSLGIGRGELLWNLQIHFGAAPNRDDHAAAVSRCRCRSRSASADVISPGVIGCQSPEVRES